MSENRKPKIIGLNDRGFTVFEFLELNTSTSLFNSTQQGKFQLERPYKNLMDISYLNGYSTKQITS